MRLLSHSLTASVFILSVVAEPTTSTDSNRTTSISLGQSALRPLLEMDSPDTPRPLEPQDMKENEVDQVRSDVDQERGDISLMTLKALESLSHFYQASNDVRPVHMADQAEA